MMALVRRELRIAVRAGSGLGVSIVFFLIVATIVPLGVGFEPAVLAVVGPGILWIGVLFSCLLNLDRLFHHDFSDGTFELLVTSPIPLEYVVMSKIVSHWITTCVPLALAAPVLGVLFNLPISANALLFIGLLIGTPAIGAIGSLAVAATLGLKRGSLLQAILALPLCIPTLIFGSMAVPQSEIGQSEVTALLLVGAISLGSLAVIPLATAYALRINTAG